MSERGPKPFPNNPEDTNASSSQETSLEPKNEQLLSPDVEDIVRTLESREVDKLPITFTEAGGFFLALVNNESGRILAVDVSSIYLTKEQQQQYDSNPDKYRDVMFNILGKRFQVVEAYFKGLSPEAESNLREATRIARPFGTKGK